jgi:hypothetical protein
MRMQRSHDKRGQAVLSIKPLAHRVHAKQGAHILRLSVYDGHEVPPKIKAFSFGSSEIQL